MALPEPAEVRMATQEYRQEQSQVARFFAESYQVAQRECEPISAAHIYDKYRQWADKQGEYFEKVAGFIRPRTEPTSLPVQDGDQETTRGEAANTLVRCRAPRRTGTARCHG